MQTCNDITTVQVRNHFESDFDAWQHTMLSCHAHATVALVVLLRACKWPLSAFMLEQRVCRSPFPRVAPMQFLSVPA